MVENYCFLVFQTLKMGHFTISVQSSERNVQLVSGTNMIFDIKNCSNNIECTRLDHNDILLTHFKSTTPHTSWKYYWDSQTSITSGTSYPNNMKVLQHGSVRI